MNWLPFAHPWVLLLLFAPVFVGIWEWRRAGLHVVLPFDHGAVRPRNRLRFVVDSAGLLPAGLLAIAVLIVAGPRRTLPGEVIREERNIQLLVDISGSMKSPYGKADRFRGAMQAIRRFVTHRKGDAFAFSVFGTEVVDWIPPTRDTSAITLAEPFVAPEVMPPYMNGTEIGKALQIELPRLLKRPGDHMIILVTDGQSSDLGPQRTPVVAKALAQAGIVVYGIFVGDTESTTDLGEIARETHGRLFRAEDPKALAETFHQIDSMEQAKFRRTDRTSVDAFFPLLCAGLLLVGLQLLASFGLRYTPW